LLRRGGRHKRQEHQRADSDTSAAMCAPRSNATTISKVLMRDYRPLPLD
jgi:hypothetical protein